MQKFDFDYFKSSIIRYTEYILNNKLEITAQKQLGYIFLGQNQLRFYYAK
jgi:hypothetical protein